MANNGLSKEERSAITKSFWDALSEHQREEMRNKISLSAMARWNAMPIRTIRVCSVEGCEKMYSRDGLCQMHHWRLRTHGSVYHVRVKLTDACSVDGCERIIKGKGMCQLHLNRKRRGIPENYEKKTLAKKRYKFIAVHGHPTADVRGRAYLHRYVLYENIGDWVVPCFWCAAGVSFKDKSLVVDHWNHDRHDCSLPNLLPSCKHCNSGRTIHNSHIRESIYLLGTTGPKVGT